MEGHGYRPRPVPTSASPLHDPDLACAARLRLNIDARLMPVDRRAPENLFVWYRPPAPPRGEAPHVTLADAIVADLGLARDATAVTLRLDGYAVSSADVLRDGDVVHVCARNEGVLDAAHGGRWPVSPAAASLGLRDAPATDPSGARPYARLAAEERRAGGSETSSSEDGAVSEGEALPAVRGGRGRGRGRGGGRGAAASQPVPEVVHVLLSDGRFRCGVPGCGQVLNVERGLKRHVTVTHEKRRGEWIVLPEAEAGRAARRARRAASAAAGEATFGGEANPSDATGATGAGSDEEDGGDKDPRRARTLTPLAPENVSTARRERCPVPGCGWVFQGPQGIPAHYKKHISDSNASRGEKQAARAALDERKAYAEAKKGFAREKALPTPPAKRPRFGESGTDVETEPADFFRDVPVANARSAPPERSRSARRKALKRARKRAASVGGRREAREGRPARAPRATLVPASFLPANAALDPNGDLARHGGSLAGWPEHAWVPHPSESVLRAAESSLAASAEKKSARRDPERSGARKIVFRDGDGSSSSERDAASGSDADARPLADADVNATESDSEDAREARGEEAKNDRERRESRPAARPRRPRSDVHDRDPSGGATRARLESLVAADHTLANQSTPVPGSVDPEDVGAALAPGDVVRYRYRVSGDRRGETLGANVFACSYFQGEVVAVEPDFGDSGGVRLAVTIAPWPERRRTEALVSAARAAAEAETSRGDANRRLARLPAPFDETCVATIGTRDVLEARLIGGPRHGV